MAELTPRETRIVELMAEGYTVEETAGVLHIAVSTVKVHRLRAFKALGARNGPHAVALWLGAGRALPSEPALVAHG